MNQGAAVLDFEPQPAPRGWRAAFGSLDLVKVLLLVLLVYVPNQLHFPSAIGSLPGFNVLNFLLLGLGVALAFRGGSGWPAPLTLPIPLFWATILIAFFVGQSHHNADALADSVALKTVVTYMLLYFLFYFAVEDLATVRLMFVAILFVTFMASVEVMREALDYGLDNYNMTHRASGPFGVDWHNANRAGVYFAIFTPLFLAVALFLKGRFWVRLAALGGFAMGTLAVFYTYSRQSYLCLALAAVLLALRRSVLLTLALVVALFYYESWMPAAAVQRIQMTQTVDESGEVELDESTESRPILWAGARAMMARHPFGIGLGRFRDEVGNYTIYRNKDAHNQYLLIGAEAGIQGLVAFVLMLLGFLWIGVRLIWIADSAEERVLAWGYTVAMLSMAMGSVYGSPVFMGEVMGGFWALSGLAAKSFRLLSDLEAAPA